MGRTRAGGDAFGKQKPSEGLKPSEGYDDVALGRRTVTLVPVP